jgi:hypothetical protein
MARSVRPADPEDMRMTEIQQVTGAEREARLGLAEQLRTLLTWAGLPVGEIGEHSCAVVGVDFSDTESGGVYVEWQASQELRREMMDGFQAGDVPAPVIRQHYEVKLAMRDALLRVLRAAGCAAEPNEDEYSGLNIRVRTAPER